MKDHRQSLYAEVTAKIIAELKAGRLPWVQPWDAGACACTMPSNAVSGRGYSGINVLILWAAVVEQGFASQRWLTHLPAHPHEGAVGAPPDDPSARVIATGRSAVTGRQFNIAVAFEPSNDGGPAIAQSTFHHFADYNWDPAAGAPSFVSEPPGDALSRTAAARRSTHRYARNLALWLAGRNA